MTEQHKTEQHNIVRLPKDPPPVEEERATPPSRIHGLAIGGMAICALIGIGSMLAFITVRWPGSSGRYIVGAFVIAGLGFLTCASAAVLTAARDTYSRSDPRDK